MEKINNQPMYRERLSKALVVCFIDRCLNLPVRRRMSIRLLNLFLSF